MTTPHIVKAFDQDLRKLTTDINAMGELAAAQFTDAVRALLHSNLDLAQRVIDQDRQIDALRKEISTGAAMVIARRQPMAGDLDEVLANFRIVEDLERTGDLAKNIAKRSMVVEGAQFPNDIVVGIEALANLASDQLKRGLEAYVARDAEQALAVREMDDDVDELYASLFQDLVSRMTSDQTQVVGFVHLLFCAKNIERIGDHATNIAESAYLLASGHGLETKRDPRDEGRALTGTGKEA